MSQVNGLCHFLLDTEFLQPQRQAIVKQPSIEQISIWILEALEEEWQREPDWLVCRTAKYVLGPLKQKHNLTDADIKRGLYFCIEKGFIKTLNRADGQAIQPSNNGLAILGEIEMSRIEKQEKKRWTRSDKIALAGFIFTVIVFVIGLGVFERRKSIPASANTIEIAEKFILSGLKSPTTAKFSGASIEQRSTNVFLVSGFVDSQNSFGAMLRGTWLCLISNSPPNHWTCIVASVDGTPIISPKSPENLELLSSQIVVFRDETSLLPEQHKYKTVKGVVKNISTHPLGQIVITYYLYNSEGNLAGSSKANDVRVGNPLKPGETWNFTTEAFDSELTAKLEKIESYQ